MRGQRTEYRGQMTEDRIFLPSPLTSHLSPLFFYILLLTSFFLIMGCGERKPEATSPPPPVPNAEEFVPPPREEIARYHYKGEKHPDPFVQLTVRPSFSEDIVVPDINNMVLRGIFFAGRDRISMLSYGVHSYYARGTRLYDSRWRHIPGFFCHQKDGSITIRSGDISQEIKLRD